MNTMLEIKRAEALDDYWVRLTLTNGTVVERNVRALLQGPVFQQLREDYDAFRCVRANSGTLEWPGEIDLDPAVVIWNGPRASDPREQPAASLVISYPAEELAAV